MKIRLNEGTPDLSDWSLPSIDQLSDLAGAVESTAARMAEEAIRHAIDEESTIFIADVDELRALMCIGLGANGGDLYVDLDIGELLKEYALESSGHAELVAEKLNALADEVLRGHHDDQ